MSEPLRFHTEADHDALVATLVAEAHAAQLPETTFDDAVLVSAGEEAMPRVNDAEEAAEQDAEIGDAEAAGSLINNGGFEEQIDYLLRGYASLDGGAAAIREIMRAAGAAAPKGA